MKEVWVEGYLLPFVYYDYSELTYFEKMNAAYSACMLFSEDVTRGFGKRNAKMMSGIANFCTFLKIWAMTFHL